VRDNIALSDPTMPMDRIIAAATLTSAHEFILELPEGYDTMIGASLYSTPDPCRRWSTEGADVVAFTDVEQELKTFIAVLWRSTPPIRSLAPAGFDTPRRACFERGATRAPQSSRMSWLSNKWQCA
jgi:hypothetical protein